MEWMALDAAAPPWAVVNDSASQRPNLASVTQDRPGAHTLGFPQNHALMESIHTPGPGSLPIGKSVQASVRARVCQGVKRTR